MTRITYVPSNISSILNSNTLELEQDSLIFPFIVFGSNESGTVYTKSHEDFITMIIAIIFITFVGLPWIIFLSIDSSIWFELNVSTLIFIVTIFVICFGIIFLSIIVYKDSKRSWSYIRDLIVLSNSELVLDDSSITIHKVKGGKESKLELIEFTLDSQSHGKLETNDKSRHFNILYIVDLKLEDKNKYLIKIDSHEIEFEFCVTHPNRNHVRFHPYNLIVELTAV